jgi:hypothetical protein
MSFSAATHTHTARVTAASERRKCPMTMSGWSSKMTVIPPRIPCERTSSGNP